MRTLVSENPPVSQFFAVGLASGQVVMGHKRKMPGGNRSQDWQFSDQLNQIFPFSLKREIITCQPDEPIKKAAQRMADRNVGSMIIVNKEQMPVGIITDTDLRSQVATGKVNVLQPVRTIMSSPVITIPPDQNPGEVVIRMMNAGVHHLCITEDGTPGTRITGIVSNHDLLILKGNSPTVLLKAIRKAQGFDELKILYMESENITRRFIDHEVPLPIIQEVTANIRDTITRRAIEIVLNEYEGPDPVVFCWSDLGSSARKEQLLKTDIDNLLIFDQAQDRNQLKEKLLRMAEKVNHFMIDCGFSSCPSGMMSHLPYMCLNEQEWKEMFQSWIYQPDPEALLKSTIFFDMRGIFGNTEMIKRIKESIIFHVKKQPAFLNYLAKNAVQNPPPLSFFNQFIVESSGEHKHEFDIKKRAIMPLVDAARVFALEHQYYGSVSTRDRFKFVSEQELQNRAILEEGIQGFDFLLKVRTTSGYSQGDDGRFVDIHTFNKIDKKIFKEIFQVIREMQKIIRIRFQLDYFH
jgi:CBS domain-containing protein